MQESTEQPSAPPPALSSESAAKAPETTAPSPSEPVLAAKARGAGKSIIDLLQTLVLAALVVLLVSTSFQNFEVEGTSMTPNVQNGDMIIVSKAAYRSVHLPGWATHLPFIDRDNDGYFTPFGEPKRGDVIVFHLPSQSERNLIKRVIGLPGDTIEIRRGIVYRNGEQLNEDYLDPALVGERSMNLTTVPENEFFVMGDERSRSFDSRDWGTLPRKYIIGKAWFSYWPSEQFGRVHQYRAEPLEN